MAIEDKSPEQLHYETLYRLFRNLIWLGSILTVVAAWFIGTSLSDIKSNAKAEIQQLREEVDALKTLSNNYLNNLKSNTDSYLNHSKYLSELQIKAIREETKYLALQSAKSKIEETFQTKNIRGMIDEVASIKLDGEIEKLIDDQLDIISSTLEFVPVLPIAVDQIRTGYPEYVFILDSISRTHISPFVRDASKKVLLSKGRDYDTQNLKDKFTYDYTVKEFQIDTLRLNNKKYIQDKFEEIKDQIFNESESIDNIINGFNAIRLITKIDTLRPLDLEQLEKLKIE